jgi:N6-adenosine-specific RNA methylase IME4
VTALAPIGGSPLAALAKAAAMLDKASDLEDVKVLRDQAEVLRAYAKQAQAGLEVQNRCAELKLRAERKAGAMLASDPSVGRGKSDSLSHFGIERHESSRWQRIAGLDEADFDAYIAAAFNEAKELTTAGALKLAKQTKAGDKDAPSLTIVGDEPNATQQFTTIVADPPWRYGNTATRGAAEDHYPTMSVEEICGLDVEAWADDDAHLYLWVTVPFLREGLAVLDAWGFTYKTMLTWAKPQMGMGNYFRVSTEHVLFGVRGSLRTSDRATTNWFIADRQRHSAKPESFFDLVEKCSPGPYLEMFARRRRLNDQWSYWGNESE